MERNGARSFVLICVLIVFSFLLVSGGPRLIGHADEYGTDAVVPAAPLRAAITQAPQRIAESGLAEHAAPRLLRREMLAIRRDMRIPVRVISDANGNVLRCVSYLHAVYQSFSLGDGFV